MSATSVSPTGSYSALFPASNFPNVKDFSVTRAFSLLQCKDVWAMNRQSRDMFGEIVPLASRWQTLQSFSIDIMVEFGYKAFDL